MSIVKTWYTVEEVSDKFGLDRALILKWVEEGVVRAETAGTRVEKINIDDIELKVKEMTGI